MSSVNKVIIVGRLGQDPEVKQFANGGSIVNASIATSERWTDKNTGELKEQTEWHRVTFQNRGNYRMADTASQYLRKGSMVYVEGSLHTRKWTDQQGIERYTTEIKAQSMQMLPSGQSQQPQAPQYPQQSQWGQSAPQSYPPPAQQQWEQQPVAPQGQQRPMGMTSSLYQPMQSAVSTQPQPITPPVPPMGQGGQVPDEDMPF